MPSPNVILRCVGHSPSAPIPPYPQLEVCRARRLPIRCARSTAPPESNRLAHRPTSKPQRGGGWQAVHAGTMASSGWRFGPEQFSERA
eukprot:7064081-Alexandrium_andersonii.AAC.1